MNRAKRRKSEGVPRGYKVPDFEGKKLKPTFQENKTEQNPKLIRKLTDFKEKHIKIKENDPEKTPSKQSRYEKTSIAEKIKKFKERSKSRRKPPLLKVVPVQTHVKSKIKASKQRPPQKRRRRTSRRERKESLNRSIDRLNKLR